MNGLSETNPKRKPIQILRWWEIRRIVFNLIQILLVAISLWILGLRIFDMEMGSGDYFLLLIYVGHLLIANFIYTFGWIIELARPRNTNFARKFFLAILVLSSVGLVALTASFAFILWS
ncbi:hypothetical protein [Flavobacterium sp.]|uniref:hypothetical protein n=1 Tax=Flavobacterium sp. TaxID=239 RepID=UPI0012299EBD|nr:hypothetical protein [Flavobacterium sp.]RZJ69381.1 MAG: hypothetical protein EOO49_17590 [Flavobacterium sp.]